MWAYLAIYLFTDAAQAQSIRDCNAGEAPSAYTGDPCGGVCFLDPYLGGLDILVCELDQGTAGGEGWVVFNYDGSGDEHFSAWGTDSTGTDFCCLADDDPSDQIFWVILEGTDAADTMGFTFSNKDLDSVTLGQIMGFAGSDIIEGSDVNSNPEGLEGNGGDDYLYGYGGEDGIEGGTQIDEIHGGDEDDTIAGDEGEDTLYGDAGADTCDGGDGDDIVEGGPGDDTLLGGDDDDILRGQNDNDVLMGDIGADILCGGGTSGGGRDKLHAMNDSTGAEFPNSADILWEPSASSLPSGSAQNGDSCGHSTHGNFPGITCSLTTRPAECDG